MSMPNKVAVRWLGRTAYADAWALQKQLVQQVADGTLPAQLLLLEHTPTYTFGRRGKLENLVYSEAELATEGIEIFHVDRGGDVTYHGPGQLVGYPILNLAAMQGRESADLNRYLRDLEQTIINALSTFGVEAWRFPAYTGVWANHATLVDGVRSLPTPHKIAAIGVKVNGAGIASHGFALNIDVNQDHFQGIIPCGISEYNVVSLNDLGPHPQTVESVVPTVVEAFSEVFSAEMVITDTIP